MRSIMRILLVMSHDILGWGNVKGAGKRKCFSLHVIYIKIVVKISIHHIGQNTLTFDEKHRIWLLDLEEKLNCTCKWSEPLDSLISINEINANLVTLLKALFVCCKETIPSLWSSRSKSIMHILSWFSYATITHP